MAARRADVADWIALSSGAGKSARSPAGRAPRHFDLGANAPEVWRRLLELAHDPDPTVRRWVVHVMRDGAPLAYREKVLRTLETLANDSDDRVRMGARKALATYSGAGTPEAF